MHTIIISQAVMFKSDTWIKGRHFGILFVDILKFFESNVESRFSWNHSFLRMWVWCEERENLVSRTGHLGGRLYHGPLPLGKLIGPPARELDEGIVAVDDGQDKGEEGGCSKGRHILGVSGRITCRSEEQKGPDGTEYHFDQKPWDDVKLFNDVQDVKDEKGTRRPEGCHGDEAVPLGRGRLSPDSSGAQGADKAD